MTPLMTNVLKSYARGVLIAVTPLLAIHTTDPWAYLIAVTAGVISPALRALDKKDAAFGLVADIADAEIAKIAKKAPAKKKTK